MFGSVKITDPAFEFDDWNFESKSKTSRCWSRCVHQPRNSNATLKNLFSQTVRRYRQTPALSTGLTFISSCLFGRCVVKDFLFLVAVIIFFFLCILNRGMSFSKKNKKLATGFWLHAWLHQPPCQRTLATWKWHLTGTWHQLTHTTAVLCTDTHTHNIPETNALSWLVKCCQVMRPNKHVRLTRWSNKTVLQLLR